MPRLLAHHLSASRCRGARRLARSLSSLSRLVADEASSVVLGFPQWQGAGPENAARYQLGGPKLHGSVCRLLPRAASHTVAVPADEPGEATRVALDDETFWAETVVAKQQAAAAALLRRESPTRVVTIGGDCGVEPPSIGYLAERYGAGNLAVLWLDAHADMNEPVGSPSGYFHGMALRAVLEPALFGAAMEALVPVPALPAQAVLGGVRSVDSPERERMAELQMTLLSPDCLDHHGRRPDGQRSVLLDALERTRWSGAEYLYVHVDLDVLVPSHLPHVGVPEPGGLEPAALLRLIKQVAQQWGARPGERGGGGSRVVGLSVTEFAPQPGASEAQQQAAIGFVERLVEALWRQQ